MIGLIGEWQLWNRWPMTWALARRPSHRKPGKLPPRIKRRRTRRRRNLAVPRRRTSATRCPRKRASAAWKCLRSDATRRPSAAVRMESLLQKDPSQLVNCPWLISFDCGCLSKRKKKEEKATFRSFINSSLFVCLFVFSNRFWSIKVARNSRHARMRNSSAVRTE